jgi:hypothetical protein
LIGLVIRVAALVGALPTVGFPATKWTPQVRAAPISRMGEEKNTAMPAADQAAAQIRLGFQDRSQEPVILQHQGHHFFAAIPLGPKLKILLNSDCKKAKLSLTMLMKYLMSLS